MARIDRSLNRIADGYALVGILGGIALVAAAVGLHDALSTIGLLILGIAFLAWGVQVFITVTLFRAGGETIRLLRSIDRRLARADPRAGVSDELGELDEDQDEVNEEMSRPEGFLCSRCQFRVFPKHSHCPGCGRRREDLQPVAE